MWIKIISTYVGGIGTFIKGERRDVPGDIVRLLPKDCYEPCKPPHEEHRDEHAEKIEKGKAKALKHRHLAEQLAARAKQMSASADKQVKPAAAKQREAREANDAALKAKAKAEKKDATKEDKAEAFRLARIANRADLEHQVAMGQLTTAIANASLMQMDAEDELAEADRLEAKVKKLEEAAAQDRESAQLEKKARQLELEVENAAKLAETENNNALKAGEAYKKAKAAAVRINKGAALSGDGYLIANIDELRTKKNEAVTKSQKAARLLNQKKKELADVQAERNKNDKNRNQPKGD